MDAWEFLEGTPGLTAELCRKWKNPPITITTVTDLCMATQEELDVEALTTDKTFKYIIIKLQILDQQLKSSTKAEEDEFNSRVCSPPRLAQALQRSASTASGTTAEGTHLSCGSIGSPAEEALFEKSKARLIEQTNEHNAKWGSMEEPSLVSYKGQLYVQCGLCDTNLDDGTAKTADAIPRVKFNPQKGAYFYFRTHVMSGPTSDEHDQNYLLCYTEDPPDYSRATRKFNEEGNQMSADGIKELFSHHADLYDTTGWTLRPPGGPKQKNFGFACTKKDCVFVTDLTGTLDQALYRMTSHEKAHANNGGARKRHRAKANSKPKKAPTAASQACGTVLRKKSQTKLSFAAPERTTGDSRPTVPTHAAPPNAALTAGPTSAAGCDTLAQGSLENTTSPPISTSASGHENFPCPAPPRPNAGRSTGGAARRS